MKTRSAKQLAARFLEHKKRQVLARDEIRLSVSAVQLRRFNGLFDSNPGQRREKTTKLDKGLCNRSMQHSAVACLWRTENQALSFD